MDGRNIESVFATIGRDIYKRVQTGDITLQDGWDGVKAGLMRRPSCISLEDVGGHPPQDACGNYC